MLDIATPFCLGNDSHVTTKCCQVIRICIAKAY